MAATFFKLGVDSCKINFSNTLTEHFSDFLQIQITRRIKYLFCLIIFFISMINEAGQAAIDEFDRGRLSGVQAYIVFIVQSNLDE